MERPRRPREVRSPSTDFARRQLDRLFSSSLFVEIFRSSFFFFRGASEGEWGKRQSPEWQVWSRPPVQHCLSLLHFLSRPIPCASFVQVSQTACAVNDRERRRQMIGRGRNGVIHLADLFEASSRT